MVGLTKVICVVTGPWMPATFLSACSHSAPSVLWPWSSPGAGPI
jgi:hypothetical protein